MNSLVARAAEGRASAAWVANCGALARALNSELLTSDAIHAHFEPCAGTTIIVDLLAALSSSEGLPEGSGAVGEVLGDTLVALYVQSNSRCAHLNLPSAACVVVFLQTPVVAQRRQWIGVLAVTRALTVLVHRGRHDGLPEDVVAAVASALSGLVTAADAVPNAVIAEACVCLEALWTFTEPMVGCGSAAKDVLWKCLGFLQSSTWEAAGVREAAAGVIKALLVRSSFVESHVTTKHVMHALCAAVTRHAAVHESRVVETALHCVCMFWTDACGGLERDVLTAVLRVLHYAPIAPGTGAAFAVCSALRCLVHMVEVAGVPLGPSVAERLLIAVLRVMALCAGSRAVMAALCVAAAERLLARVQLPISPRCQGVVARFDLHATTA